MASSTTTTTTPKANRPVHRSAASLIDSEVDTTPVTATMPLMRPSLRSTLTASTYSDQYSGDFARVLSPPMLLLLLLLFLRRHQSNICHNNQTSRWVRAQPLCSSLCRGDCGWIEILDTKGSIDASFSHSGSYVAVSSGGIIQVT
uniref:Uncharacterized protein n=1 Tax=Cyclophora tenuis TaxID=216820 RepID=A0A7S1D108_CYCTE|mmetsp:Transcript_18093/g.30852  ORF Transcript_18093/g.30852 Transcript_18093/m.30852 type:complete len:145 (+) Transcript_18093:125-559(+)